MADILYQLNFILIYRIVLPFACSSPSGQSIPCKPFVFLLLLSHKCNSIEKVWWLLKKSSVDILVEISVLESPEPKKSSFYSISVCMHQRWRETYSIDFLPNSQPTLTGYRRSRWIFNQLNQFHVWPKNSKEIGFYQFF